MLPELIVRLFLSGQLTNADLDAMFEGNAELARRVHRAMNKLDKRSALRA